MKPKAPIQEAIRRYMTPKEIALRKRLVQLLKDDGKGHYHAKYAERLAKFDVNIVPLKDDPRFTAAISYEHGVIYIGEGFLNDPKTFHQLNVVMRHELAHNLLMHEIRMMKKLGNEFWENFKKSPSFHELLNIIMDDEISNKKYSVEDKNTMRNLMLNGQLIKCLVTEDHREHWLDLTVEEMYEKVCEEIEEVHARIIAELDKGTASATPGNVLQKGEEGDFIKRFIQDNLHTYSNVYEPSLIEQPLDKFVASGCVFQTPDGPVPLNRNMAKVVRAICTEVINKNVAYDPDQLEEIIKKIARSSIFEPFSLANANGQLIYKLNTPEDKFIAQHALKKLRDEYTEWYNKVLNAIQNFHLNPYDVAELFNNIKAKLPKA